jgi:hypothetical protein
MRKLERTLFRLGDSIIEAEADLASVTEELRVHRQMHDNAKHNAAAGHAEDRVTFQQIKGDRARFERALEQAVERLEKLRVRRGDLLAKLDAS